MEWQPCLSSAETLFSQKYHIIENRNVAWPCSCIFRPAFGCCAPQLLVKIVIFCIFYAKKQKNFKKVTNLMQNLAKNGFFKFASKCWSSVLFPTLMFLDLHSATPRNVIIAFLTTAAVKRFFDKLKKPL